MPTALITGITGQDGSYLAEALLKKGYEVVGMVRRSSTVNYERIAHIQGSIEFVNGDLLDQISLIDAIKLHEPDEIYNLGANKPQTINKLAKLISDNFQHIPKRPGEPNCTWANINKIKSHLNWNPIVGFEHGVSEMIKLIDLWKKAPLLDKKSINKATAGKKHYSAVVPPRKNRLTPLR